MVEKTFCDVCDREITDMLNKSDFGYWTKWIKDRKRLEICPDCTIKIVKFIKQIKEIKKDNI